jgi:hypothetical protein
MAATNAKAGSSMAVNRGQSVLSLSRGMGKCAFDAEMKTVECKTERMRLPGGKKLSWEVTGTFFLLHTIIRSIMGQRHMGGAVP